MHFHEVNFSIKACDRFRHYFALVLFLRRCRSETLLTTLLTENVPKLMSCLKPFIFDYILHVWNKERERETMMMFNLVWGVRRLAGMSEWLVVGFQHAGRLQHGRSRRRQSRGSRGACASCVRPVEAAPWSRRTARNALHKYHLSSADRWLFW